MKKYFPEVIVGVFLLLVGGLLGKYVFTAKPELSYQVLEGDPIQTEVGEYYPTTLILNNTGDTPLGEVRIFLTFQGKIVKVSSNVYGDKVLDDSVAIRREFRMPKNTYVELKATTRGKLKDIYVSSAEVAGTRRQQGGKEIDWGAIVTGLVIGFFVGVAFVGILQDIQRKKGNTSRVNSPT